MRGPKICMNGGFQCLIKVTIKFLMFLSLGNNFKILNKFVFQGVNFFEKTCVCIKNKLGHIGPFFGFFLFKINLYTILHVGKNIKNFNYPIDEGDIKYQKKTHMWISIKIF